MAYAPAAHTSMQSATRHCRPCLRPSLPLTFGRTISSPHIPFCHFRATSVCVSLLLVCSATPIYVHIFVALVCSTAFRGGISTWKSTSLHIFPDCSIIICTLHHSISSFLLLELRLQVLTCESLRYCENFPEPVSGNFYVNFCVAGTTISSLSMYFYRSNLICFSTSIMSLHDRSCYGLVGVPLIRDELRILLINSSFLSTSTSTF